jgi:hypothetical protein
MRQESKSYSQIWPTSKKGSATLELVREHSQILYEIFLERVEIRVKEGSIISKIVDTKRNKKENTNPIEVK